jgi:hypothetical protein
MNTLHANENGRDEVDSRFALVDTSTGIALRDAWLWAAREEGATS